MASTEIAELAARFEGSDPRDVLSLAFERCPRIALSFSGAEDVVLIDIATSLRRDVKVFCLDTGRLHAETYQFLDTVRERYPISLEVLFPEAEMVQQLVTTKGLFSFFNDGHTECCEIRKVTPLRRKLAALDGWVTGLRKDQNPSTRAHVAVLEEDHVFSTTEHRLLKFNPLASWTSAQVWQYIRDHDIPHNALHARGFKSIGCEPCTRPVLPHQHEREGRWWWEEATKKECGLHWNHKPRTPEGT